MDRQTWRGIIRPDPANRAETSNANSAPTMRKSGSSYRSIALSQSTKLLRLVERHCGTGFWQVDKNSTIGFPSSLHLGGEKKIGQSPALPTLAEDAGKSRDRLAGPRVKTPDCCHKLKPEAHVPMADLHRHARL